MTLQTARKTKKKILVADDDAAIVDVVSIVLKDAGYDVMYEKRGDNVHAAVRKESPHMVLLDIWLSGAHGAEVVKALKENAGTANIPVILMSANSETEKIAKECGADGFLAKPFNIDDLLTIVEQYVK